MASEHHFSTKTVTQIAAWSLLASNEFKKAPPPWLLFYQSEFALQTNSNYVSYLFSIVHIRALSVLESIYMTCMCVCVCFVT